MSYSRYDVCKGMHDQVVATREKADAAQDALNTMIRPLFKWQSEMVLAVWKIACDEFDKLTKPHRPLGVGTYGYRNDMVKDAMKELNIGASDVNDLWESDTNVYLCDDGRFAMPTNFDYEDNYHRSVVMLDPSIFDTDIDEEDHSSRMMAIFMKHVRVHAEKFINREAIAREANEARERAQLTALLEKYGDPK